MIQSRARHLPGAPSISFSRLRDGLPAAAEQVVDQSSDVGDADDTVSQAVGCIDVNLDRISVEQVVDEPGDIVDGDITVHVHIAKQIAGSTLGILAKENLHFVCLDVLGSQRENVYAINRNIEALIKQLKPQLVVIDDIDHFMPFCGVHVATEFCRIVRDVTNHTETAFLFIGYNHLGKKASTTGNLGKYLFLDASDVFSLSTQREVTTVRLVRSYDLSRSPDDTEYRFTIGDDNLPHEAQRDAPQPIPEGCVSSTSHTRNQQETSNKRETINTSLTLPPHLPSEEPSRITRCQRVNKKSPVPHQPVKVLQSPASKVASRIASDSL